MPDSYFQVPFAYYDNYGNPIDANGNIMDSNGGAGGMGYDNAQWSTPTGDTDQFGNPLQPSVGIPYTSAHAPSPYQPGFQQPGAGVPDWQIATGSGAAPPGSFLPDWRPGAPDQAGATDQNGVVIPRSDAYSDDGGVATTTTSNGQTSPFVGGGSPNGPSVSGGSLIDPFTQTFNAPPPINLGGPNGISYIPQTPNYKAPVFTPPTYKPPPAWGYKDFVGPNAETVLKTPGYQFRLNQGEQALQNAKAAQGILGTGATLKAILGYGQDYASNEFQNEWNREYTEYGTNRAKDLDAYNTNYGTQYVDPYKFAYQGAMDAFAPQMAEFNANVNAGNLGYQTQAAAGQHQNDQNYLNAWNNYLFDYNKYRNQKLDTFNMQWPVVQA